ncbi:palmitoyltransferase ZDHHC6 [Rhodnius prolixus]|uniref:Palmitoyltransferase n=1 Tax=Rhodnius neglectus TaxID=72488 RepID=A0A0P4VIP1_9HEMI
MCIGPLKRLCHWGPITALGIIKIVSFMMVHCCNMLLPPTGSFLGFLNMITFLLCSGLTIYNFLSSMFEGPGYLPLRWLPEYAADEAYLQFCKICEGFKAPRSHHCRKCGRCVLKMDHHCPWINNCVGHANHAHFTLFLFFSVCGCVQAAVIMSISLYRAFSKIWYSSYGYENPVHFTVSTLALTVFAIGLAIGVVLSVGALFFFQIRAILRNRTGIEDWILAKAILRREPNDIPFIYPYNLGWKENFKQVFSFNFETVGDGITWPVVQGCHQFTLTIEQKEQKQEKRLRTKPYLVCKKYNGWWFPITHGWKVCLSPPLSDEPRIPLNPSETVNVTRWRKYWLFGEKVTDDPCAKRLRGWFPRCCVIEIGGYGDTVSNDVKKNQ